MRAKAIIVMLIAVLLGGAVLALFWNVVRSTSATNTASSAGTAAAPKTLEAPNVTFVDQILGPKDAAVTIVEFGDYVCTHCRTIEADIERLLAAQPKRLRYVWKDMPSPLHPGAETAAEAGLCAAKQGAFWDFHRALFDAQSTLDQTSLTFQAGQAGLDIETFADCLSSHATQPFIERTLDEGKALGIDALPTFFINGKRYVGALSYEELVEAVRP